MTTGPIFFSLLFFSFIRLSFFLSFFCWTLHGWKGMPIIIYHWFFLKTILHEQKTWFHVLQTLFTKILKLTNLFAYRTCKILFMISINKIFKLTLKLVWIPWMKSVLIRQVPFQVWQKLFALSFSLSVTHEFWDWNWRLPGRRGGLGLCMCILRKQWN